jgi:tripartite-type tricarboxylate transporter receptor subunit TctC
MRLGVKRKLGDHDKAGQEKWGENAMNLRRRYFLRLGAGAAALPLLPRTASAQAYPSRPVRIVVGVPAGGTFDLVARLIGQWLSERLGQQFVIENRPGAATNVSVDVVAHASADGYTLLLAGSPSAINATLYEKGKLNFDFMRDIAPVAGIERMPLVMAVNPALPVKTVPEFISYAKANPTQINQGSGGIGSTGHVSGELFKMLAGVSIAHVPYRGEAPALTDLLGGQVQVVFSTAGSIMSYLKAGSLRALAVTTEARLEALSDVPPLADFLPGYEASAWGGIGAPGKTPAEIIDRLNKEINAGLADPKLKAQLADLGATVLAGSPADFGKLIAAETEKWGKVIKFASLKAE